MCLRLLVLLLLSSLAARADTIDHLPEAISAVMLAERERQAAVIAADRAKLEELLSEDLHYAHSNGKVDTKAALIDTLVSGRTDYETFEYQDPKFLPAGDGAVVIASRVIIGLTNADGRQRIDLNILAVWRKERDGWRFLAWQSSRNPESSPTASR